MHLVRFKWPWMGFPRVMNITVKKLIAHWTFEEILSMTHCKSRSTMNFCSITILDKSNHFENFFSYKISQKDLIFKSAKKPRFVVLIVSRVSSFMVSRKQSCTLGRVSTQSRRDHIIISNGFYGLKAKRYLIIQAICRNRYNHEELKYFLLDKLHAA